MFSIRWLGVAGLEIISNDKALLIDPFLSRPSKFRHLIMSPVPDPKKIDDYLAGVNGDVAGILVGHTHSDHVLDVPYICSKTKAPAYGTRSLATLFSTYEIGRKAMIVAPGVTYSIGPFEATPIESVHGRAVLGMIPFPGEIQPDLSLPLRANQYRHGGPLVWYIKVNGLRILHLGSADFIDENLEGLPVDVLFACAAGRQYTPNFAKRLISLVRPKVVVPFHFDDFFSPIRKGPVRKFVPGVNLEGFIRELSQIDHEFRVITPEILVPLEI